MRRAVLDPGVLVSALITPDGTSARLLSEALAGGVEMIVSSLLLDELGRVLGREKFRRYVDLDAVQAFVDLVQRESTCAADPSGQPPMRCTDPDDDYLISLASSQNAIIVSGDRHLLELGNGAPILTPGDLLQAVSAV